MEKQSGYQSKQHASATKRYCQTLDLKENSALIETYKARHQSVWPEIKTGIRQVGILDMEIYLLGNRLFMIVETSLDFHWETAMQQLASLPRQEEWETYMAIFQDANPEGPSSQKWKLMERIFVL